MIAKWTTQAVAGLGRARAQLLRRPRPVLDERLEPDREPERHLLLFDSCRLVQLQRDNKRLYRAYLLKNALVGVLDCRDAWLARIKLDEWIRWARRSRLAPFKRVAAPSANTPTAFSPT